MTTRLHEKAGLRPPCLNPRTGGSGHAQCRVHQRMLSAPPRYDVKPVRFALNQGSRKLCSEGVTCPGLIRCVGLEQLHEQPTCYIQFIFIEPYMASLSILVNKWLYYCNPLVVFSKETVQP